MRHIICVLIDDICPREEYKQLDKNPGFEQLGRTYML